MRRPSDAVEALLQKSLIRAEEGEWEEAAELLREGMTDHPDDPYLLCWLGMAERELGLEGIAYERFRRALAQGPEDPVLLATAGNALAGFDDPEAEIALRTAAMIAPELPQARWMYGAYLVREGMVDKGVEELEAALRLDPDDPVIHVELGVARLLADDLAGAAHWFGSSAELDHGDGWSLVLLGLAWLELDEVEEGARALEEGARLRPEDLDAQVLAALALAGEGRDDAAVEMLERARLNAEGMDEALVFEVEERIEEGPESALRFLRNAVGPSSLRERAMQRP
ncbi:MAG: tetratricopeptide repeat protein [Gemmatimonadota bacterium]